MDVTKQKPDIRVGSPKVLSDRLSVVAKPETLAVDRLGNGYAVKAEGVGQWLTCPQCKTGRLHGHGSQEQLFQDTPSHGQPVAIVLQRRRYRCTACSKTQLSRCDLDGKRQATARLVCYIREQSFTKTFVAPAREFEI